MGSDVLCMMMGNRVSSLWREAVKGTFALIFKHMRVIYFQHQGRACGPEEKKKGQDDRRGQLIRKVRRSAGVQTVFL